MTMATADETCKAGFDRSVFIPHNSKQKKSEYILSLHRSSKTNDLTVSIFLHFQIKKHVSVYQNVFLKSLTVILGKIEKDEFFQFFLISIFFNGLL